MTRLDELGNGWWSCKRLPEVLSPIWALWKWNRCQFQHPSGPPGHKHSLLFTRTSWSLSTTWAIIILLPKQLHCSQLEKKLLCQWKWWSTMKLWNNLYIVPRWWWYRARYRRRRVGMSQDQQTSPGKGLSETSGIPESNRSLILCSSKSWWKTQNNASKKNELFGNPVYFRLLIYTKLN